MGKAKGHAERAHALLSASGASRWLNCTPSARLEEAHGGEDESSVFAQEGTLAHEFGELELRKQTGAITTRKYNADIKKLRAHELYTSEMEGEVEKYTDYVLESLSLAKAKGDAELLIEEKVDLSHLIAEGFGTCDANVINDGTLEVIDLKYGKGLQVHSEENAQLKIYGLGALRAYELLYDIVQVKLTIVQPRLNHLSSWTISVEDLEKWAEEEIAVKADLAHKGEGEQCAGEWCRWCKVSARCTALAERNLELTKLEFSKPQLLTDEQLIKVYEDSGLLQTWAKSVASYILNQAIGGKKFAGYKVVEGNSNRKWVDDIQVSSKLKSLKYQPHECLNVKPKGIGDIEKLVGKRNFPAIFEDLVTKPPGKPTLVPDSDKREALDRVQQAKNDFGED